jgi:hypothetical protein
MSEMKLTGAASVGEAAKNSSASCLVARILVSSTIASRDDFRK